MHGCLCEWDRGTWHSSCPTCRGSTDSWARGGGPSLPPSSYAQFHISADLPPPLTPSPSLVFSPSPSIYSLLFPRIGPVSDAHYIRCYFGFHICPQLCLPSPIPLCPLSVYHWILLKSSHYPPVINFSVTAMSTLLSFPLLARSVLWAHCLS